MTTMARLLVLSVFAVQPALAQDTLVVRADNPPVWGENAKLVEELRIGRLDGPEAYNFGDITGLVVDDQGVVWVADRMASKIRRFRPDGIHLDDIGRKGEGPGEFDGGYGISLARTSDGRVLAYDPLRFLSALSVFGPDGRYIRGMPVPLQAIFGSGFQLRVDTTGVIYLRSSKTIRPTTVESSSGSLAGRVSQSVWIRLSPEGRVLDSVLVPSTDRSSTGGRRYPFGYMYPYTANTTSSLSPLGYLVVGRSDRYVLYRPVRDGRVLRIERSFEPVRATREEQAQYQAQLDADKRSGATRLNSVQIPSQKPPFWAMDVDDQGRIWVARHQPGFFKAETPAEKERREHPQLPVSISPPIEWLEALVTDVIEPNGRYLGSLAFPSNKTKLAATRGDTIWVIEQGELDEQYVVRYRIEHR